MEEFVDSTLHELTKHGSEDFPATVYKDSYSYFSDRFYYAHYHNEIEILLIESGEMEVDVNENTYKLQQGDVLFIHSNHLHKIKHNLYPKAVVIPFLFNPSFISSPNNPYVTNRIVEEIFNKNFEAILIKDKGISEDLSSLKMKFFHQEKGYELDYLVTILKIINYISIHYESLKPFEKISISNKRVRLGLDYIFKNYRNEIMVCDIAKQMNLSISESCRLFKRITGSSIVDYLLKYRVNIAINLLKTTDKSITDIAYEVGFSSSNYFTIAFKKITGMTPREMRKKI